jgi:hypothetical protein
MSGMAPAQHNALFVAAALCIAAPSIGVSFAVSGANEMNALVAAFAGCARNRMERMVIVARMTNEQPIFMECFSPCICDWCEDPVDEIALWHDGNGMEIYICPDCYADYEQGVNEDE